MNKFIILLILASLSGGALYSQDYYTETKLFPPDGDNLDFFGGSVAVFGDYVIIGSAWDDDNGEESGSVYVFERIENDWILETKLTASDGVAGDRFGASVAFNDRYLVVGAVWRRHNGVKTGAVYLFKREGDNWIESIKLIPNDLPNDAAFGLSLDINGEYTIAGAYRDNQNGPNSGSAYIYKKVGENWIQEAKLLPSDGDEDDTFGYSVSISGEYALVGAPQDSNKNGLYAGSAYLFRRNADGLGWSEEAKLIASDGMVNDDFGRSVAIEDGYTLVGQPGNIFAADPGAVYIFKQDTSQAGWIEYQKLSASDGSNKNYFGVSVSLDNDSILIGAPGDSVNGQYSGSAYIFKREGDTWTEKGKLTASDGNEGDWFGISTSLNRDQALTGAYLAEHNGIKSGAAYLYWNAIMGIKEENIGLPLDFRLSQNYPNPFNSSTIIHYQIPGRGLVNLMVYDILGKEIAILVNSIQSPGSYQVQWNADNLSSGVYIYKLQVVNLDNGVDRVFTSARKLMLLK